MEVATLSFANIHNHGELFANLLRARRQSFIERNRWDLPEAMGMEYDQYDTPASRWIAVHEMGIVRAGIRLTPTTARCGIYSYMIRDAQRGLLDTIPSDLLYEEAPVCQTVWESSRVFVSQTTPHSARARVHAQLIGEMTKAARELGVDVDVADLDDPRLAVVEDRAGGVAGHVLGVDGDAHQALVVALRVLALDVLDDDAALARDARGRDHVDGLQHGPQRPGQRGRGERARVHARDGALVLDAHAPDRRLGELAQERAELLGERHEGL